MKKTYPFFTAILLISIVSCSSNKTGKSAFNTQELIDKQAYTFVARSVFPMEDPVLNVRVLFPNASNMYQLNSYYDVRVTPDSVIAYLPFFGRSYTAPIDNREGGIKFTSTDFTYKQSLKKNMYEIEIIPKDVRDVRNLYLSISPNGYASLRIFNLNRSPITFNGEITKNR